MKWKCDCCAAPPWSDHIQSFFASLDSKEEDVGHRWRSKKAIANSLTLKRRRKAVQQQHKQEDLSFLRVSIWALHQLEQLIRGCISDNFWTPLRLNAEETKKAFQRRCKNRSTSFRSFLRDSIWALHQFEQRIRALLQTANSNSGQEIATRSHRIESSLNLELSNLGGPDFLLLIKHTCHMWVLAC